MIDLVADTMWGAALLPLLPAFVCRRSSPSGSMIIAVAFAVSFAGGGISRLMGEVWEAAYLWLPIQLGLVLYALLRTDNGALWWALGLGLAMAFDVLVQGAGPDLLITMVGSAGIVLIALDRRHPLRVPLMLYFGLGSALYLAMTQHIGSTEFLAWWAAYQSVRVLAWVAYAWVLVRAYRAVPKKARVKRRQTMKLYPVELPVGVSG